MNPLSASFEPWKAAQPRDPLFDVIVVGSGYGGSVAALRWQKCGRQVTVLERQIASEDAFAPRANRMSLLIHGGGVFMKLDSEGRLPVTDFIRDYTGITTDVTFVGRADHFQLWAPQTFLATQAAAREEFRTRGLGSE